MIPFKRNGLGQVYRVSQLWGFFQRQGEEEGEKEEEGEEGKNKKRRKRRGWEDGKMGGREEEGKEEGENKKRRRDGMKGGDEEKGGR